MNPMVFIIIFLIIVAYYTFSSSLGNKENMTPDSNSNSGSNIMGIIIVAILIILIIANAFQYFFSINITAYIQGLFEPKTEVDIVVDQSTYEPSPVPEIKFKKQVFNIPGNYYNYENAKALCKAYGADLASYDQIEKAYNNGAEWCNYGWSANQLALFPRVRFGVNCYGNKPKITSEEEELMKTTTPYPETAKDKVFQKRVDFWKNKVDEILVAPFNYNTWGSL